jgi:hypothetical protein
MSFALALLQKDHHGQYMSFLPRFFSKRSCQRNHVPSSPLFSALLLSPQKIKMCLPMVSSSSPLLLLLSKYNHHWHMSRKLRCMDAMSRVQHQRARCPMELGWDAAGPRSLEDSDGWLASPRLQRTVREIHGPASSPSPLLSSSKTIGSAFMSRKVKFKHLMSRIPNVRGLVGWSSGRSENM